MKKLALCACIAAVAAAACTRNDSRLDGVSGTGAPAAQPGLAAPRSSGGDGASVETRLSRVERRLDKVISLLEQNLPPDGPDRTSVYSVPVSKSDPIEGPADAKVTIIEAFEFLCPYCYVLNPTIQKILETYPKDVRIVSKYLLIHGEKAALAGQVGCAAAKQGKYPQVKAALWNGLFKMEGDRPTVQTENVNLDAMKKLAVGAGADAAKLDADLEGCKSWIQDSAQALQPVGVNSTPSFFINGRFLQSMDFAQFDAMIKQELARADKAVADGVPQGEYYQREIVAKGIKRAKGRFED
jgi:protein-disulfide isomerase